MKKVQLPLSINVARTAQKREHYVGVYMAVQLTRIGYFVVSIDTDAEVTLSFSVDNKGFLAITGMADLQVTLVCQRCCIPFSYQIHTTYCFSPVSNNDWNKIIPKHYELIEANALGEVNLLAMLEDEMILSLPVVPLHAPKDCQVSETERVFGRLPIKTKTPNPFAVLASLKINN